MSNPAQPQPCTACGGAGVTEHTNYKPITNPDGTIGHEVERFTGPCGRCSGSGRQ